MFGFCHISALHTCVHHSLASMSPSSSSSIPHAFAIASHAKAALVAAAAAAAAAADAVLAAAAAAFAAQAAARITSGSVERPIKSAEVAACACTEAHGELRP